MSNAKTVTKTAIKNVANKVRTKLVQAPVKAPNAFTAFVAAQQKTNNAAVQQTAKTVAATNTPATGVAVQQAAKVGFTRTVQNGRGNYTPHTIGAQIWACATALQAATPGTPVTSAAVRLALPHVAPASVSAGLSHWRKFNGTMRVKGKPAVVVTPTPVTA
jgi:hypothetical protein